MGRGHLAPAFPNAKVYVSETEWHEMRNPNIRSRNTYWKENWEPIVDQVITFQQEIEITDEIKWHIQAVIVMDMQLSL